MRLIKRLAKLEDEFAVIDLPVERIFQRESLVRLRSGREMTYEEYQRQLASGEIRKFYIDDMVKKMVINDTDIIKNGSCRKMDESK